MQVGEHLVHAQCGGVQAGTQRFAHGTADQAVDHVLRAAEQRRRVVADHQRLVDELQVAVVHAQRQAGAGNGTRTDGLAAAGIELARHRRRQRAAPAARWPVRHQHRLGGGTGTARAGRGRLQARQTLRVATGQQLDIGRKGAGFVGQLAVCGLVAPGAHARQQRAGQRHAAVAIGGVEVLEPVVAEAVAGRREAVAADDEQHLLRIGAQRRGLRVEPLAQRDGQVEHDLRRRAPAVGAELRSPVVPEAALAQAAQVVVGQVLARCWRGRGPARDRSDAACSWMKPGIAAITSRVPASSNRPPKATSVLPKVSSPDSTCIGAHEPPFGVPSISSRAPSRAISAARPRGHSSCIVRATSPPIECASSRTGWPLASRARQRRLDHLAQAPRLVLDRAAPVVGELDDLVRGRQVLDQVVVDHADRAVGRDTRGRGRVPGQALQAADQAQAEPDALAVQRQVRAEDAGQHDHRRPVLGRHAGAVRAARTRDRRGGARAARILPGPRQRADEAEVGRLLVEQAAGHGVDAAFVGEVVEVRDLAHRGRARRWRRTRRAPHRRTSSASAPPGRCRSSRRRRRAASSPTTPPSRLRCRRPARAAARGSAHRRG